MNTAAPSRKKLLSLVLTLVFMLTCLPAALAVDLNVDAGFYFKQSRGGTCTLASAAMMLRYSFDMDDAAAAIDRAVENVLDAGIHTADIAINKTRVVNTAAMGDAIVAALR